MREMTTAETKETSKKHQKKHRDKPPLKYQWPAPDTSATICPPPPRPAEHKRTPKGSTQARYSSSLVRRPSDASGKTEQPTRQNLRRPLKRTASLTNRRCHSGLQPQPTATLPSSPPHPASLHGDLRRKGVDRQGTEFGKCREPEWLHVSVLQIKHLDLCPWPLSREKQKSRKTQTQAPPTTTKTKSGKR